jgi:chemotaxis regulatin CheY-phosphate phosphatase CheZ
MRSVRDDVADSERRLQTFRQQTDARHDDGLDIYEATKPVQDGFENWQRAIRVYSKTVKPSFMRGSMLMMSFMALGSIWKAKNWAETNIDGGKA